MIHPVVQANNTLSSLLDHGRLRRDQDASDRHKQHLVHAGEG